MRGHEAAAVSCFQTRPRHQSKTHRPGENKEREGRAACDKTKGRGGACSGLQLDPEAMGRGVLEVHLVDAKGLFGSDFLGKIDPYVIVQYRSQERKSSTARDEGRNPSWNEVFRFQINSSAANGQHKLFLRIMDHDNFSSDDFLGQATINVSDLITLGMESGSSQQNPAKYSVVSADNSYHGEIRVGISFTATKVEEDGAQVGGWTHSSRE